MIWTAFKSSIRRAFTACGLLTLVALAGCANIPEFEAPKDVVRNARGVAVASVVGDEIWIRYVGMTVFENSETKMPVVDWKIDERIESLALDVLRAGGVARVERLQVDRAALTAAVRRAASRIGDGDHRRLVLAGGFTVAGHGTFVFPQPKEVETVFSGHWALVDVQRQLILSSSVARMDPARHMWQARKPIVKMNHEVWPKDFNKLDESHKAEIRAAVDSLIPPISNTLKAVLDPPDDPYPR